MRNGILEVGVLALLLASACATTHVAPVFEPERPDIAGRLLAEWAAIEDVYQRLARASELERDHAVRVEPEQLYLQLARQQRIHAQLLGEIFEEIGWPTPVLVGEDASRAALAMAVNAPPGSDLPRRAEEQIRRAPSFSGRDDALAALGDPEGARTLPSAWLAPAPPAGELVVPEPPTARLEPTAMRAAGGLPRADLAAELLSMQARDQEVRYEVAAAMRKAREGLGSVPMFLLVGKQKGIDAENLARLKEIVSEIGWPTAALVGKEGARAAWILAQHADSDQDFQADVLAWIKPLAGTDGVSYADVALLTDRVRVARGEPQRFGTQWVSKPIDGVTHFGPSTPIEDRDHVDERRALVGLPPLEEYLGTLREVYGVPQDAPPLPVGQ